MGKFLRNLVLSSGLLVLATAAHSQDAAAPQITVNPLRDAFYGDLHLHTTYSFDAYVVLGTKVTPDQAYRFAKGEKIEFMGQQIQRRERLDFLAVTDHAENIGAFNELENPDSEVSKSAFGKEIKAALAKGTSDTQSQVALLKQFFREDKALPPEMAAASVAAWAREIKFANANYEPGKFTTFIGYEWTSAPGGANLHRNVIFKGDAAPAPFTSNDSKDPKDLWQYLEKIRQHGYEAIAIPHNGNVSNGLMYDWTTLDGRPIDKAYAEMRQANEPLTEISQGKGSSETYPTLSATDEFSNFEIFDHFLTSTQKSKPEGSYVRDALGRGLVLQSRTGINPFKYGFVGGSDLHSGLSVSAQADYAGNVASVNIGPGRPTKEQAAAIMGVGDHAQPPNPLTMTITTAGNLTGAWAESNTRESLYAAFRRRETFATSGTRLKFRFFGSWRLPRNIFDHTDWVKSAYATAVSMGSDLPAIDGKSPKPCFTVWAVKDPNGGNLDRIQIIKVWAQDGQQKEKVFDVAWSGNRKIDHKTGKLPAVGNTVDLSTGQYANTIGAAELKTVWINPEFNPKQLSAYYLRVIEIPTPRWTTLLALQTGLPLPSNVDATVQQRGWSSPIWYSPAEHE